MRKPELLVPASSLEVYILAHNYDLAGVREFL